MASSAGGGGAGGGDNSRTPRSMQGLLKFCMEQTKNEDASGPSQFEPMSEERKQWLSEALSRLQDNDPVKAMLTHIKVVLDEDASVEDQEDALDELEMYCEDIDLACDFHKIGGYEFLNSRLHSNESGIRWRAANLIAMLVQNNPYCQERAYEMNLVGELVSLLDKDPDVQVQVKALYALSSLCRDVPVGQELFAKHDGFSVLLRAMQTGNEKLQTKASFMLRAMCVAQPEFIDTVCNMGMVEQLISILKQEHQPSHEYLFGVLCVLVEKHTPAVTESRRPELGLQSLLIERKPLLQGKPEYEEELAHVTALQQMLFNKSQHSTVDR